MINFNEMPFNRFAEVMRSKGDYSKFCLLNMLAAARAGDVPASVKAAFDGYNPNQSPKPKVGRPRIAEVQKAAADAGHPVYHSMPCVRCGGALRYTSTASCVVCSAARLLARDADLRNEIADFIKLHGMDLVRQVHSNGAKRLGDALDPESDLSCGYLRSKLRQDMRTVVARFEGLEIERTPEQEARYQEDLARRRERYKRRKEKQRQEMAA